MRHIYADDFCDSDVELDFVDEATHTAPCHVGLPEVSEHIMDHALTTNPVVVSDTSQARRCVTPMWPEDTPAEGSCQADKMSVTQGTHRQPCHMGSTSVKLVGLAALTFILLSIIGLPKQQEWAPCHAFVSEFFASQHQPLQTFDGPPPQPGHSSNFQPTSARPHFGPGHGHWNTQRHLSTRTNHGSQVSRSGCVALEARR